VLALPRRPGGASFSSSRSRHSDAEGASEARGVLAIPRRPGDASFSSSSSNSNSNSSSSSSSNSSSSSSSSICCTTKPTSKDKAAGEARAEMPIQDRISRCRAVGMSNSMNNSRSSRGRCTVASTTSSSSDQATAMGSSIRNRAVSGCTTAGSSREEHKALTEVSSSSSNITCSRAAALVGIGRMHLYILNLGNIRLAHMRSITSSNTRITLDSHTMTTDTNGEALRRLGAESRATVPVPGMPHSVINEGAATLRRGSLRS